MGNVNNRNNFSRGSEEDSRPTRNKKLQVRGIPIELVKHRPSMLWEVLVNLFNIHLIDCDYCWMTSTSPSLIPFTREEMKKDWWTTSSLGRPCGWILEHRIEKEVTLIEEQNGFEAERLCVDNIFTIRHLIKKQR